MEIREEKVRFRASDGFDLGGILFHPRLSPKGLIQINSGTGIPREFYSKLARHLADDGFLVLSYDYRGIGASRPASLRGFEVQLTDWGTKDMPAASAFLLERHPRLPLLLLGHSVGGQLAGLMPNHAQIRAAVFLNSSTGTWFKLSPPYRYFTALVWYGLVPFFSTVLGYLPAKRLGLGEDLPKGVARQWGRWCRSSNYLFDHLQDPGFPPQFYDQVRYPILSVITDDDPIANTVTHAQLLENYPGPTENRMITRQQAGQKAIGHLGFMRRPAATYLWPELSQWLSRQVAE